MKSINLDTSKIIILEENTKDLSVISNNIQENVLLFMIKPEMEILNTVISISTILKAYKITSKKYLIFIPGENNDIMDHLLATNTLNYFIIDSLNFDLIPVDIDLLSLERDNTLKEIYIENNLTSIDDLAYAFVRFENSFGKVKYKYIKGDLAENFCRSVEEKENDMGLNKNEDLLGMVVLDRSVDFLTLISSNYTFEGLIEENIGINLGKIKIQESILKEGLNKDQIKSNKLIAYSLSSKNNIFYCSFRCMHYLDVNRFIVVIRDYYKKIAEENKNKGKTFSISKLKELTQDLNEFVRFKDKLIMLENILNHIMKPMQDPNYIIYIEKEQIMLAGDLPENLYSLYEEHLYEKRDLIPLLKLMIIESLTQNGIKDYQKLKREILNIYGYQNLFLFRDLETIGWLKEKIFLNNILNIRKNISEFNHNQLNEKLGLVNLNFEPLNIKDCSYVFGGYCPLSLRLIENAIEGKWEKIMDTLKKIPGYISCPENENILNETDKEENIMIIVFLGGITYTEIEGIRYLNRKLNEEYLEKKRDKKLQLVIMTTGILSTKKIFGNFGIKENPTFTMKQFSECLKNKK